MARRAFMRTLLATGLGTGFLPVAPGTWASAAAGGAFVLVAWATAGVAHQGAWVGGAMIVLAVAASVGCVGLGRFAEETFGQKDPHPCTIDEWAGQALALAFLPLGAGPIGWLTAAAAGFVAFRLFDILKPFPAGRAQKLPRGWGILLDDLVAGVYANGAAQLFLRLTG